MALFTQRTLELVPPSASVTPMAAQRYALASYVASKHEEARVCELNFGVTETDYGTAYPSPLSQIQAGAYESGNVWEGYRNLFLELEYGFNGITKRIAFDAKVGRYFIGRVDFARLNAVQWRSALAQSTTLLLQSSISEACGGDYDIPTYTAVKRTSAAVSAGSICVPIGAYEMEGIYTCDAGTTFWGGTLSDAIFQGSCNPLTIQPSTSVIVPPSGRVLVTPSQHTTGNESRVWITCANVATANIDIGARFYLSI